MPGSLERSTQESREPRVYCAECGRPASVCVCAALERVETRTRVVILQHPRESIVPINTARLAELALSNAERHVGIDFSESPRVRELLGDARTPAILLYPGPGARDLASEPPEGPVTLVVLDGTWWQSKKLLKSNPALAKLPRYAFDPVEPSRYRIRREPERHCVSTIEAIAHALAHLERGQTDVSALLKPFDAMVEHQLRFIREGSEPRHVAKPRSAQRTRWPAVLAERSDDLVVGYGEANAWPRGTPLGDGSEIVHLVAERVVSGERFEAFVAPRRPLAPSFTHHTGIAPDAVLSGESFAAFVERWRAFLRPNDILGGWGYYWSEALRREGAPLPERVDLRELARRALRSRPGDVEECAARLDANPERAWAPGRTGRRAAGATAVARALIRLVNTATPSASLKAERNEC
jgi:DTW domain-containing protein